MIRPELAFPFINSTVFSLLSGYRSTICKEGAQLDKKMPAIINNM